MPEGFYLSWRWLAMSLRDSGSIHFGQLSGKLPACRRLIWQTMGFTTTTSASWQLAGHQE
jgi:hypothetical protein